MNWRRELFSSDSFKKVELSTNEERGCWCSGTYVFPSRQPRYENHTRDIFTESFVEKTILKWKLP